MCVVIFTQLQNLHSSNMTKTPFVSKSQKATHLTIDAKEMKPNKFTTATPAGPLRLALLVFSVSILMRQS
jgi:hypothetical protein